ncbi:hypothetical protein OAM28_01075 [Candidatus Pelagibacter sp.]|jgi:hypothetical protein|nr:hypothetical protein [Candidatus Pelagibacter sp.]MDC0404682.1 hypothetical protein [Candidatus Pelagibacter sp.]|tara:strand:- start:1144 stop:1551 length:408 start_codon:yes stop_codon:yes gene_type:complete
MKNLLGIVILIALTNFAEAKDYDWTGKRAMKYAKTMCLALGVKEENIKNSPWYQCWRQNFAVAQEYEKQYAKGNSNTHSGDYLKSDLQKIKKKKNNKIKKIDINQAKKTCINLGFVAGTEKFADCSLKIIKMKSQ